MSWHVIQPKQEMVAIDSFENCSDSTEITPVICHRTYSEKRKKQRNLDVIFWDTIRRNKLKRLRDILKSVQKKKGGKYLCGNQ